MNKKLFTVFVCLMVMVIIAIPVTAKTDWTEFEGMLSFQGGGCDPENEWLSKDFTKVFGRDCHDTYSMVVDDARLEGTLYLTFNFNFKYTGVPPAFFYGPIWGSIVIENEGGTWKGNFNGSRSEEGFNYGFSVLHGTGEYEGMLAHLTFIRENTTDPYGDIMIEGLVK